MTITDRMLLMAVWLAVALAASGTAGAETTAAAAPAVTPAAIAAPPAAAPRSTADHAKFEELKQAFQSGPEVTRACLKCHTEAAKQIHKTKHWTWEYLNPATGQRLGKKNVINNFCTAVPSNEAFCTACHIGYGWKDASFDFTAEENVDCLVCHDGTGKYKKLPGLAGHPNYTLMEYPPGSGNFREPVDLAKVAQAVTRTSRKTCGTCHFFGGGGDAVKHGDLDSSLTAPQRYLDVHMDAQGLNFACSECHVSDAHEVSGSRYAPTAADPQGAHLRGKDDTRNKATCQACHGNTPHTKEAKLNDHTDKVACQTCHIPAYARSPLATKMSWDWSTAGRLTEEGKRLKKRDAAGHVAYDSFKGDFTYERYVIPEYMWFNGEIDYTLPGDPIDPNGVVRINRFRGGPEDPAARIWPVKVFRGKQPYDQQSLSLAVFHTAGKDDAAYWGNYDWDKAIKVGMAAVGREYSGDLGFVATEMSWPITHMVAPKDDALRCAQCHSRQGRLAGIGGVYLPGRDASRWLDTAGFGLALLALIGVLIHGGVRIVTSKLRG